MRYEAPVSVEAASTLLSEAKGQSFVLAGGTDLLVRMKGGFVEPELIVDIKHIAALREIRLKRTVSSSARRSPAPRSASMPRSRRQWPGVVEAAKLIGSTQVQGRCTMGGNLCNASPAADSVPALIAAGARSRILGRKGTRSVAVEDIPVGPGKTSLAKGEIIEAFLLRRRPNRSGDAYLRFIPRTEMDIAVVGAGVEPDARQGGTITAARVALGAVAPTVLLVAARQGARRHQGRRDGVAKPWPRRSAACQPIDDKRGTIEFRIKVAGVLARRAAQIALERAGER